MSPPPLCPLPPIPSPGVAVGLQSTLDDVGKGLGPALVSLLVADLGRTAAFNIAVFMWAPCGIIQGMAYFYGKKRREREKETERGMFSCGCLF